MSATSVTPIIGVVVTVIFSACSTLQVLEADAVHRRLPSVVAGRMKSSLVAEFGEDWIYRDRSGQTIIYGFKQTPAGNLRVVRYRTEAEYELVLVFGPDDRLKDYSLLKKDYMLKAK